MYMYDIHTYTYIYIYIWVTALLGPLEPDPFMSLGLKLWEFRLKGFGVYGSGLNHETSKPLNHSTDHFPL